MPGDLRVVEDGVSQEQLTRRRSPWVWIAVGVVIGVGFGVVFSTPTSPAPEPEAQPVDETAPAIDPVAVLAEGTGITEAIEGFGDAMVAITRTGSQNLEHLLWPIESEPVTRPLAVGGVAEADFDVTGTWLAVSTSVPDSEGGLLSAGKPASLAPLASNVTSFIWHDGTTGILAYTQEADGVWTLSVSQGARPALIVASGPPGRGDIVAFGDWGFAIEDDVGEITLLNANAEIKSTAFGQILHSSPDGWLVLLDDELKLMSAGGGIRALGQPSASIGAVEAAALSPDGDRIAVLGTNGLKVSAIDGEMPTVEVPFTTPISKLTWTADSRFVVVPFLQGVIVVDTETGRTYEDLVDHTVIETGVIPLSR